MASTQQQISSGSDGDQRYAKFDERKRKRMISNRESARRSRMKKQQHVDEMISQVSQLKNQNKLIMQKINEATDMFVGVASDNNILRAQISELTDRLYSLNSVLHIAEEFTVVLLVRHLLALLTGGTQDYPFTLLTLLIAKTSGIVLPMYILIRIIASIQNSIRRGRYEGAEDQEMLISESEEDEEEHQLHRVEIQSS